GARARLIVAQGIAAVIDQQYLLDVLPLDRLVEDRPGDGEVAAGLKPAPGIVLEITWLHGREQPPAEREQVTGDERLLARTDEGMEMARRAAAAVRATPVAPDDFPTPVVFARQPLERVVGGQMIVRVEHHHDVLVRLPALKRLEHIASLSS